MSGSAIIALNESSIQYDDLQNLDSSTPTISSPEIDISAPTKISPSTIISSTATVSTNSHSPFKPIHREPSPGTPTHKRESKTTKSSYLHKKLAIKERQFEEKQKQRERMFQIHEENAAKRHKEKMELLNKMFPQ